MPQAYFNGEWIDDRDLLVPVADAGFALGVTVTERLRTFRGLPFRQSEHVARLRRSLEIIGLPSDQIAGEIDSAVSEFVERNKPLFVEGDDWAIVAFATPGSGGHPTRCVHGFPLPFQNWARQYDEGLSVQVSDHRQTPSSCWPPELKCRSRMHYYLADQQANRREPGAKALLLDQEGFVGEAATANVVVYRQGEGLISPPMEKVLPGVSVAVVKEIASQIRVAFSERELTVEDLLSADEVMLTSTSVCTLPVVRCNGQAIGSGRPGEVFAKVLAGWSELTDVDIAAQARRNAVRPVS